MPTEKSSAFLDALRDWRGRDLADYPTDQPPCGGIGDSDQDAVLARIFKDVAAFYSRHDDRTPLFTLVAHLTAHENIIKLRYDAARGNKPTDKFTAESRAAHVASRPYEAMVQRLREWLRDFYEWYVV